MGCIEGLYAVHALCTSFVLLLYAVHVETCNMLVTLPSHTHSLTHSLTHSYALTISLSGVLVEAIGVPYTYVTVGGLFALSSVVNHLMLVETRQVNYEYHY